MLLTDFDARILRLRNKKRLYVYQWQIKKVMKMDIYLFVLYYMLCKAEIHADLYKGLISRNKWIVKEKEISMGIA